MISSDKWRSDLSGQRGTMKNIEGGRIPEFLVEVHTWKGHKNIIKSKNFFDATNHFQFVLKILSNFSSVSQNIWTSFLKYWHFFVLQTLQDINLSWW